MISYASTLGTQLCVGGLGGALAAVVDRAAGGETSVATAPRQGPLEVRLTGGDGYMVMEDFGKLLDTLSKEAGDRGYRLMVAR